MGIEVLPQVIPFPTAKPPAPPPGNALVPTVSYEELDRQARGGATLRGIEQSDHTRARLRRRSSDLIDEGRDQRKRVDSRDAANDAPKGARRQGRGEFGLHLATNPYPERVQHSSPFVAQLIGQQFSGDSEPGALDNGLAAYDGAAGLSQTILGAYPPLELVA